MTTIDLPKYIQLKNYIKSSIQDDNLKPGEKIYSENELSEKFSISRHTVRQAIGELVNEGLLNRVQGSGTFVNVLYTKRKEMSKTIGVITTYLDDYIFPSIIKGIDNVLSSNGYSFILAHTDNKLKKEGDCLNNILEKNVDGLIIEATKSALPNPNLEIYREIKARNIPFIFINSYYAQMESSYIIEDDELGGYEAAKHLIELGHRNLGGIFKVDDMQGHRRYKGFSKAQTEMGMEFSGDAVIWFTTEDLDIIFSEDYDKIFMKRIENFSALVCYNDQVALRVLAVFRRNGIKVPTDISIVSFDDSELAQATEVKLTTIAHPHSELGEKAAECLLDMIMQKRENIYEVIEPKITIRQSTKKYL